MRDFNHIIQVLNEEKESDESILDYHNRSKEEDPTYLRWLFENLEIEDWGIGLTEKQEKELKKFEYRLISVR